MTTEAKVIEALRRGNIKFNEHMVVCRPSTTEQLNVLGEQSNVHHERLNVLGEQSKVHGERLDIHNERLGAHDEEFRVIRKSISIGTLNQNPWEETFPNPASAGGYSRDETRAAHELFERRKEEKEEAEATYLSLKDDAKKISLRHPIDKIKAENAAKEALERYKRKKRNLVKAEAKPAYKAFLNESSESGSDAADDPTYFPPASFNGGQSSRTNDEFYDPYRYDANYPAGPEPGESGPSGTYEEAPTLSRKGKERERPTAPSIADSHSSDTERYAPSNHKEYPGRSYYIRHHTNGPDTSHWLEEEQYAPAESGYPGRAFYQRHNADGSIKPEWSKKEEYAPPDHQYPGRAFYRRHNADGSITSQWSDAQVNPPPASSDNGRPSGNNQTGLNIQYATHSLTGELPLRPSGSGSTHTPTFAPVHQPIDQTPRADEDHEDLYSDPGPSTSRQNQKTEVQAGPSGTVLVQAENEHRAAPATSQGRTDQPTALAENRPSVPYTIIQNPTYRIDERILLEAKGLYNFAAYVQHGEQAIATYDTLIRDFGGAADPEMQELVAKVRRERTAECSKIDLRRRRS